MVPTNAHLGPIPAWVILWVALAAAVGLFAWRVVFLVRLLGLGRPELRWDHVLERVKRVMIYVFGQRRMLDEPLVGIPHVFIFYGFLVFLLATSGMLLQGLLPGLPIPRLEENRYFAPVIDIFAAVVLIALAVTSFRRFILRPEGLQQTWDATFVNILIASLMVTYLGASSFGIVASATESSVWTPVASGLADWFGGSEALRQSAATIQTACWWAHVLIVLFFLAYLPYSKHLHLLASPFSVFFSRLDPHGRLPASAEAGERLGAERLEEFTWRQLLSAFACAECGRCERACPSHDCGEPCSPRQLIHNLKVQLLEYGPALLKRARATADGGEPALIGGLIAEKELWACTTCLACAEHCPVLNEHLSIMVDLRRRLVERGALDGRLQESFANLQRYGNSFGQSERKRAVWTQGLEFKPKDARKEPVEWLWYLGEYACYHPALQDSTRSLARVLHAAGLDFGILYEAERNTGNDARRAGEEGLFELLRDKNTATLQKAKFNNIFSTDPHVYNTLKNEYPDLNHGRHRVHHYTELLADLVDRGRLKITRPLNYHVTYHDPCYLGRYNGVYDAPRRVLKALGVNLKEMPRSRRDSFCCGGGGGRVWMEEMGEAHSRPSENRVKEAAALAGVEILVVACPKDYVMFTDALKTTGLEGRMVVRDLIDLVAETVLVADFAATPARAA
ncbi:MAG: heterodisulfide reductase-related iron-sulfur binding cluster [Terriglobia bacterium]